MHRLCEYGGADGTQAILKQDFFLQLIFFMFSVFSDVVPGFDELGIQSSPHPLALVVLRFTSKHFKLI
jgi:hypothetical protein